MGHNANNFTWPAETSVAIKTRLDFIYRNLRELTPAYILDVGCGTGEHLTSYLAKLFGSAQVIGVDSDISSIQFAKKQFGGLKNISFLEAIPDNIRCDAIILSEVLEHVENPIKFLVNLTSYLKPGGTLIVTVPNGYGCSEMMAFLQTLLAISGAYGILRKLKYAIFPQKKADPITDTLAVSPHINFFTLNKVRTVFNDAHLDVTGYQGRMFLHNWICSQIIDKSEKLARANAQLGKTLPAPLVSDWMFVLKQSPDPDGSANVVYTRNTYEKLRRYLNERQVGIQKVKATDTT